MLRPACSYHQEALTSTASVLAGAVAALLKARGCFYAGRVLVTGGAPAACKHSWHAEPT